MFRVDRVINNNVISAREEGREVILTGRGLGFGMQPGSTYDPARVERRFVLADEPAAAGFKNVISELPYEVLVLSNRIADHLAEAFGLELGAPAQLALADHIQYAVARLAAGERLANSMTWELKATYPAEFQAALQVMAMIRDATGVSMPIDEAGFITMHLVNARRDGPTAQVDGPAPITAAVVALVERRMGLKLDVGSVAYARFLTHLKFSLQRIESGQLLSGPDSGLYPVVRERAPQAHACALEIGALVAQRYQVALPDEELLYLMLHINRLAAREEAEQ
ncbi:MAG: PRD domain-containing protein [Candidatus Nanopelagicales bacterium]